LYEELINMPKSKRTSIFIAEEKFKLIKEYSLEKEE